MIIYQTGKIYIGKDMYGNSRHFCGPSHDAINEDFEKLPDAVRKSFIVRKQVLWESTECTDAELAEKEVELIRRHASNNPEIGYNQWPPFKV
jgi:hypothetical protein